ncbi:DCD domain-containing protein NRP-B, partial [Linum grandiflorum]
MAPPAWCYDAAFYEDARFRILSKSEVGGVIFCCNDDQITECLEKKLLGLQVMVPVDLEKIDHGMPLFLFNTSDKKFHGIFERADDGKQKRFIQIRPKPEQQYQPLPLARLERMIDPNDLDVFDMPYVYFELHHIETEDLLALFQGIPTDLDLQSLSISAQTTVDDYYESCEARFQQAVSYYASLKEAKAKDKVEDDEMDNMEDDEMDKVEGEHMEPSMWEYRDWEYDELLLDWEYDQLMKVDDYHDDVR